MAKYTMELRELISTFGRDEIKAWFSDYQLSDFLTPEEIQVIEERDVWSKDQLAERILDHFYLREIGTDAPGSFKLFAKDRMNELMETYVPLIYSAAIKFDPLVNVDYTEEYEGNNENVSNNSTHGENSGLEVSSDTPQGEISKTEILQGKYASSTNANESINDTTGQAKDTGTQNYTKRVKGNSGVSATAQALIEQYREYIRALNTEIVYQLEPLFMGLY